MVGAERVTTAVRELQAFDVSFRDNRDPHAASPAMVGAGTVFSQKIIDSRPGNAAPWRVEIEDGSGETVSSFDVQFGNRKTFPCRTELRVSADRACDLTNVYGPLRRTYRNPVTGVGAWQAAQRQQPLLWQLLLGWEHPLVEWARRSTQVERVSAHGFDSRSAFNWASSARFSSGVSFLRKVSISRLIFFRASSNIFSRIPAFVVSDCHQLNPQMRRASAFLAYVALGARRSVREAAHQNHIKTISTGKISSVEDTTVRTWLGWSARHKWVSRGLARDEWIARTSDDQIVSNVTACKLALTTRAQDFLTANDGPNFLRAARALSLHFPPMQRVEDVSERIEDRSRDRSGRGRAAN